jgi:hypothetical protein
VNKLVAGTGGLLAAGLTVFSLVMAPSAMAQPPAPNSGCGAGLLALSEAETAAADALAADSAAADAKKADDALDDANAAVDAARAAAVNGGVATADLTDSGAALRARKAALLAIPAVDRTAEQNDELIKIDAKLTLIDAFIAAQSKAAAAKIVADKTDADALRREADKTDAGALNDAVVKASAAADRACGSSGSVRFENCDQVRAAGKAPLRFDQPGYRVGLDTDRDGLACEAVENTRRPGLPRIPTAIDTGYFGS